MWHLVFELVQAAGVARVVMAFGLMLYAVLLLAAWAGVVFLVGRRSGVTDASV